MPITPEMQAVAESRIIEQSKKIEFYLTEYTLELLAKKMEDNEFEIPSYQRADTWEPERKSRFIESLLMQLPIPFLFFWEKPDSGKLEIVDGSQRLRTIHQFIHKELQLADLETLSELNEFKFADLTESRQRKFKNRSVRGIVLNEHADEQARFEIFERINTGSKIANKAEVRRGALTGPFLDMVIELAENHTLFHKLAPIPEGKIPLREREELITRFFAYGDGLDGYRDRPSDFIFQYAKKMNSRFEQFPSEAEIYRKRFDDTMRFVEGLSPLGFRRSAHGTATPRARFEAISIGSYFALRDKPAIRQKPPSCAWLFETEFNGVVGSDGANVVAKLTGRIEFVRARLVGG